ncbi:MAG: anti-sigma factor antagonist [Candidatus Cloacimonetes bacterium]|nr:anti-sigma factor antagonist [Candidatus Cloacimonadota bacterium]
MFEVKVHSIQDYPCLRLKGRLDGLGAEIFEKETGSLNNDSAHWIVDFENVDYMSSAGMRALLKKEKELRKKGGMLILFGLDPEVEKVLALTGLAKQFILAGDLEEALAHARSHIKTNEQKIAFEKEECSFTCIGTFDCHSAIDIWNNSKSSSSPRFGKDSYIHTNLKELGFSLGIGGFGNTSAQAEEGLGLFLSLAHAAGVSPADGFCRPDFLFTNEPVDVPMYVAQGLSFSGNPSLTINKDSAGTLSLEKLLNAYHSFLAPQMTSMPAAWGFAILAEVTSISASKTKTKEELCNSISTPCIENQGKIALIFGVYYNHYKLSKDDTLRHLINNLQIFPASSSYYAHAFILDEIFSVEGDAFNKIIHQISQSEHVMDVVRIESDTIISNAKSWIFLPSYIRSAEEKRLVIEITEGTRYETEWDTLVRRIYADCGRVILDQLHGGFTSITFRVTSYDKDGRRLLPTVLKIGSVENNDREVNAYHKYVKKFILNNSTTIMGTTTYKNWGGLRYNFLGINGPDSNLVWLADYYKNHPAEKLIPIFDRIFTEILKPWYGQPQWEPVYPYAEHSPLNLFSNLFETLEQELDISPDDRTLHSEELERDIINPYYFLKYEYPKRKSRSQLWYKSISHGDLNMQNILLDEKENIYIIDFSETKSRNIVEDFARLEPIFKIEMCSIENEVALKEMLQFEQGLLVANRLNELPLFTYNGNDPMVKKAYEMICKLREYSNTVTLFETDIIPYLIALLEWTYPIVCYIQLNKNKKRYAILSAALICEKIVELEDKNNAKL